MSTEVNSGTHCPDCGTPYKERLEDYYPPAAQVTIRETTEADVIAEAHRDFECPTQKQRDHVAALEAALRYFGAADTLGMIAQILRTDEHDGELIWGNADRWLKKEAARPLACPSCNASLGVIEDGQLRVGAVLLDPADEGTEHIVCVACENPFSLRTALAALAAETPPGRAGGIGTPRAPLSLVQPTSSEQEQ